MQTYLNKEITEIHVLSHLDGKQGKQNISTNDGKVKVYRLFDSYNLFDKSISFLKLFLKIKQIHPDIVHFYYAPIPKSRFGGILGEPLLILFLMLKIIRIPFFVTLFSIWYPNQIELRAYELTKRRLLSKLAKQYFKALMYFFGTLPNTLFIIVTAKNSKIMRSFSQSYHIPSDHVKQELHGIWKYDNSAKSNIELNSKRIVCLGFIVPNKGYEYVLMAMKTVLKKIPDASLIIAGSTISAEGKEYFKKLHRMSSELCLEESVVIEERYLSENEFTSYITTAGVVILPYVRALGASGIMSLALSYRIPVIAAGSGPLFEEVSEIVSVVPPMNPEALADEIIKILGSVEYRKSLLSNCEKYISEHDWAVVARDNYEEYIKKVNVKKND
jgi:glycosyltransferase involved in cell wall biosynthesis